MNIIIDRLAIHYRDEGNGPVVLMLHGWGSELGAFEPQASKLAGSHRVVRLDLPGFGSSELPPAVWGVEEYGEFVLHFLAKLNLQVDTLIGHSFGGRVAIKLTGEAKLVPRRLVLVATAGIKESDSARNQLIRGLAKSGKAVTALPGLRWARGHLRRALYDSIGSRDYLTAGPMREVFLKVSGEDLQATASRIKVPTLIVWGAKDRELPLSYGQRFQQLIAGSKLEVVPEAGHFVNLDQAAAVNDLIEAFIK